MVLFLLFAVSGCDVSSCSCGLGEGGGLGGGRSGAHTNPHASAHKLMHGQCWLQMLAKSVWRATYVHPSKHESGRRVSVTRGARKRAVVRTQCMDKWRQSCKTAYQLSFTLMSFATCVAPFGGMSFPLRHISAMRWLQFVDSDSSN